MTGAVARRTQQERSEATVALLVRGARELFGTHGYANTSLDDITSQAGLSKGALYHHFPGKPELFGAVFAHEQQQLAAAVVDASRRKRDPWEAFFEGCRAFLERSLDPQVQRITLIDAPAVLGWEQMRELEAPHSNSVLAHAVRTAVEDGRLARRDPDVLARLLLGAMCEGVALVAASENPKAAIRSVLAELRLLLTPDA